MKGPNIWSGHRAILPDARDFCRYFQAAGLDVISPFSHA